MIPKEETVITYITVCRDREPLKSYFAVKRISSFVKTEICSKTSKRFNTDYFNLYKTFQERCFWQAN